MHSIILKAQPMTQKNQYPFTKLSTLTLTSQRTFSGKMLLARLGCLALLTMPWIDSVNAQGVGSTVKTAYPNKPIRLVVGFTPGGAADYVARSMSDQLSKNLGQPVIVENRPGAGSSIGADFVAHSAPDGYTLLIASPSSISVNPSLNMKLNYSLKDFIPITKITSSPLVIAVNPNYGINSVKDLITLAKKSPGKINYATSGIGSAPHLGGTLFTQVAGIEMTPIPFKGGASAMQSVVAGDTQLTFGTPPSVLPMVNAERLKAIGISQAQSSTLVPNVPGMKEAGLPDYSINFWYGVFAPTGTPPEIIKRIYEATIQTMQLPAVQKALAREGTEVEISKSPEDFANFLIEDGKFWVQLAKKSGAKAE